MRHFYRKRRILLVLLLFMLLFSFYAYRLFYLQLVAGGDLAREAVRQRAQSYLLDHGRGDIRDRSGVSLLDSREKAVYVAFPSLYRGREELIEEQIPSAELKSRLLHPPHLRNPFLAYQSSEPGFSLLSPEIPGLLPVKVNVRYGPDSLASHTVGHIRTSDGRPERGIEYHLDEMLSGGAPSLLSAVVDGRDRLIPGLGYRLRQEPGQDSPYNVLLTLDFNLQREVETLMDEKISKGAVVAVDPRRGDILAVASRPDYDRLKVAEYQGSREGELINRAVWSYQPGSIFKTVIAAAALEEGKVELFDTFSCYGEMDLSGREGPLRCTHSHPGTEVNFTEALAYSCNTSFVKAGLELGPELIESYACSMGLGKQTGWPLGEHSGNVPRPGEFADDATLANISLGQGALEVTPLQVARMMSVIAGGGELRELRLLQAVETRRGGTVRYFGPARGRKVLSNDTVNYLKYMLRAVTAYGTGRDASVPGLEVGGKTGTAQYYARGERESYFWFAGMAPLDHPELVVVVFIEEKKMETSPAVVFSKVVQSYFAER